jgi:outer membrane protein TolC
MIAIQLSALLVTLASAPPEPALPSVTLSQALDYAREHQPLERAAWARVEASRAEADVPRARRYPTVGATMQLLGGTVNNTTAEYLGSPNVDIPRIGGSRAVGALKMDQLIPSPSTMVALGLRQPVFDFGKVGAASHAADALVHVEEQRAQGVELDVEQAVVEAYLSVHAAHAVVKAAVRALERAQAHRAMTLAAVNQGLRAPVELARADAEVARMDAGVVRAQGTLATTQAALAGAMGHPAARVEVAGSPPQWPPLPTLEEALRDAALAEPAVREARARLEAARARTDAVGAELRPELLLAAGVSTRSGGAPPSNDTPLVGYGLLPYVPNGFVGLVFNWPMLDPVILARHNAAGHQEAIYRQEADVALQHIQGRVASGHVAALVARDSVPALERALEAARANQAQVQQRYAQGLGTILDVADAEAFLLDAETQLAVGNFQVARARAALDRAMGSPAIHP